MKTKFIVTATSLVAAAAFLAAVPAFAKVGVNAGADVEANVGANVQVPQGKMMPTGVRAGMGIYASTTMRGRSYTGSTTRPYTYIMGSSTRPFPDRGDGNATSTENRMQNGENRGDNMIGQRIDSLNKLLSRIQGMIKLSDSDKASFQTSIQAEITDLTNLKTKIDSDNSTTSLKDDLQSVTKSYRVYALVEPKAQIAAASDRILNIVSMLGTVVTKIQTRISADATLSSSTTIQADLADITSKTADASTQAHAAITETASLQPDNGNTAVATSNATALKDARTKIQAAQKDLQAAEKDVQAIVKIVVKGDASLGNMGTSTRK